VFAVLAHFLQVAFTLHHHLKGSSAFDFHSFLYEMKLQILDKLTGQRFSFNSN